MTQEEKQLLLKDICARLPYGVKGLHRGQVHELFTIDGREANNACIQVDGYDAWFSVDTFKPYLRPISSMTEEEGKELEHIFCEIDAPCWVDTTYGCVTFASDNDFISTEIAEVYTDWLNKKMFDYRGLIEKGLALEAPEDMYKTE